MSTPFRNGTFRPYSSRMKAIELRLNRDVVGPLLAFIAPVLKQLEHEAALALPLAEEDDELAEIWCHGLIHTQVEDCRCLMGLFDGEFRDSGRVLVDLELADQILRASSAIRLKVREIFLTHIPDSALEGADFDFAALPEPDRTGFEAYLFFATLQEVIIRHLDG